MKVMWDGADLQISKGDEIEILRGMKYDPSRGLGYEVRATKIINKTRGATQTSRVDKMVMLQPASDFKPPLHGYVKNIEVIGNETRFELEEKAPPTE